MPSAIVDKKQGTYVIPAQHTDRLRNILAGVDVCPVPRDLIVQQIFSADYAEIISVPLAKIVRLPTAEQKAARLVQCANFKPEDVHSCTMGDRCKFVHADTEGAFRHSVHINYAWPELDAVTYPRFAPGKTFKVAAPSSKTITDVMESHMVLQTKALTGTRRPLSHCAHYYFNRTCNLGSECQFIHAVFIDPHAKPYQRAPAPTQLGRPMREVPIERVPRLDPTLSPSSEGTPNMATTGLPSDVIVKPFGTEGRGAEAAPPLPLSSMDHASPGAESSGSDTYAPSEIADPLAAAMLGYATPSATPTRATSRCTTPQVSLNNTLVEPVLSPCVGGTSFPGGPATNLSFTAHSLPGMTAAGPLSTASGYPTGAVEGRGQCSTPYRRDPYKARLTPVRQTPVRSQQFDT